MPKAHLFSLLCEILWRLVCACVFKHKQQSKQTGQNKQDYFFNWAGLSERQVAAFQIRPQTKEYTKRPIKRKYSSGA